MQGSSFDTKQKFSGKDKRRPNKVEKVKGKDSRLRRQRREDKWVAA